MLSPTMRCALLLPALAACRPEPAELLFTGGTVYLDVQQTTDALAVIGGEVVDVGDAALARERGGTEVVALDGGVVFPGMIDGHTHLLAGSFVLDRLLLQGAIQMSTIVDLVSEYDAEAPDEPWLVGYGWFQELLQDPDGRPLDAVAPDRPVLLVDNSGHAALVNGAAMARAGIDADTPDPPGGEIVRDPETGEPTGLLLEEALSLVSEVALADYPDALLAASAPETLQDFAEGGLTGIAEIMASPGFDLARPWIYADMEAAGELPLRVHYYVPIFELADVTTASEYQGLYDGELVHMAGGKIWVDGSMGTASSWTIEPSVDDPDHYGSHYFETDDLVAIITEAEARGVPLKLHANGDAAVQASLDAFEQVRDAQGLSLQHVMDHVVLIEPADRARMAALGIVPSVQPAHYLGASLSDSADALGDERFDRAYGFKSLYDDVGVVAMGTDWPVWLTPDPLVSVWMGANTRGEEGLSVAEGMRGYSEGSAMSLSRSDLGTLHPGAAADLVIFESDPMLAALEDVPDVDVRAVYVAGVRSD